MTTQDKIDNAMLCAVVESRLSGEPLELSDSVYNLEVAADGDSWFRFDETFVTQLHLDAADALLAEYPDGYRDRNMDYATACRWCKTWATKKRAREKGKRPGYVGRERVGRSGSRLTTYRLRGNQK